MIQDDKGLYIYSYPEPPLVIKPGTFQGTPQELRALVLKQVENHPETFGMWTWIGGNCEVREKSNGELLAGLQPTTTCGTTLCIAGYAQLFVDGKLTDNVMERAEALLDLDEGQSNLFFLSNQGALEKLRDLVHED
jgi:hypothetical protein